MLSFEPVLTRAAAKMTATRDVVEKETTGKIIKNRKGQEFIGFKDLRELASLVWECAYKSAAFDSWLANDRTKDGLLAIGKRPEYQQPSNEFPSRNPLTFARPGRAFFGG